MALKYVCSKFNYTSDAWHYPYLPPGFVFTDTLTHGGKGVTFHVTQERTEDDGCPDDPEPDGEFFSSYVQIFVNIKACKPYRITVSGHGCSWFSYPIVDIFSGFSGEGGQLVSMSSPTQDATDICEDPPEALELNYWSPDPGTNPAYFYSATCNAITMFRIDIHLYTGLCNNDQEVLVVIEPDT